MEKKQCSVREPHISHRWGEYACDGVSKASVPHITNDADKWSSAKRGMIAIAFLSVLTFAAAFGVVALWKFAIS